MRSPEDTDTRVVVADVHGNYAALTALLETVGAIDSAGERVPGFWTCQVGDLIHGGHDVTEADKTTLELGRRWFDCLLYGNHDLAFMTSIPSLFAGVHLNGTGQARHPSCQAELNRACREGAFQAAVAVDGWLVTHAGLTTAHLFDDDGVPCDPDLATAMGSAQDLADHLNERFETANTTLGKQDLVIDGVSPFRGGKDPLPSIFWADLKELLSDLKRLGSPVPQIVGHTPRASYQPKLFTMPFPRELGTEPVWSIDLAGINDGFIAALVKKPGRTDWERVVIDRPPRPLQAA